MKKQKLLPILAAACCSFAIAGAATVIAPTLTTPNLANAADSGTLLNGCDQVGTFWCAAGTSVNADATYIEQGSGSVCVSTAGWAPINLDWGTSDIANYSYIKMTVWSSAAVKFLAGDIDPNVDPDCVLADLTIGRNEVTISVDKLVKYNLTARTIAPYLSGATTLYFDNIVGYMSAPASTTLLNACDTIDGFWCNNGTTLNTDSAYIEQGSGSVKMSFSGWAPMNINWGTSSIANYDYVKMTIWSSAAVKFLAGNINFIDDPDCILAELAIGKNELMIPVEKLVKYNLTDAICAPYVSGDCTLYVDNIVGIINGDDNEATTPSATLNDCDTADGTWVETNGNYTIESTLMTQGKASIRLNLAAGNYFKLTLRSGDTPLTKEQLLSYDYLVLDICNNESSAVDLFLYDTKVATLSPNWNSVTISKATIEAEIGKNAAQFTDGKFYFKVATGCTLLVDNVRGMSQEELNASYADFNGVSYSAATTGSPVCVKFGASSVTTLTAAQASAAGVPSGYTDNVIYATGGNQGVGVLLDFSALQIPYTAVESITFRVFFPAENAGEGYPDIRIYNTVGSNTYVVNYDASTVAGAWYDFVLGSEGSFNGSHDFSHLATDGYLGQFEFAIRSNNTSALYIDSISYKLTTDIEVEDYDTPVITYHGENTVYTLAGEVFSVEATAYDKTQGNISVKQTWSAGAVDASGKLTVGTHTLTLTATDLGNNTATKQITVIGVAPDSNAPVISVVSDTITLFTDTKPQLIPNITDDSGYYTIATSWSNGALSSAGRLQAGTHTLTITATDLSGNSASKTITVIAVAEGDNLVDESTPVTYTFSANGGSGSSVQTVVAKGEKVTLPSCPFTAPDGYTFKAWAIGSTTGEQKQVGDTVTISADTTIYALWEQLHTHNHSTWDSNETEHWKVCDCGDKTAASAHTNTDKNHLCDDCNRDLGDCVDDNKDHKCDVCEADMGEHKGTETSHICEYCGQPASDCADSDTDKDHNCDVCGEKMNDCVDDNKDHKCDVCEADMGEHKGTETSHICEYCGQPASVCNDSDTDKDHNCDVCGEKMNDCVDDNKDHKCDVCEADMGDHKGTATSHICEYCGQPASVCADSDTDKDHNCDVCGEKMSDCVDDNKNHKCDVCEADMGDHKGTATSHICEYCGQPASDCNDSGADLDHNCDICGEKLADCADSDTDKDHNCDICGEPCGDHTFDGAWAYDNDGHWQYCNCGQTSTPADHFDSDTDTDHNCDTCGKVMENCTDSKTDGDHLCDVCGEPYGDCDDSDSDHHCDDCQAEMSTCADNDNNHTCDVCGATLSACEDDDHNHHCDVCGNQLTDCQDGDSDGNCDICGEPYVDPTPDPETPPTSVGCFSSIGGTAASLASAAVALALLRKKKRR